MMIRLLLLLVALAFSGVAKAQRELTIYENAGGRNVAIPVMFASFKNYARTQFIIPASELSAMAGGKIHVLKFYTNSQEAYTSPSTVDIYMKEVNYTALKAFESKSSCTVVYRGQIGISNGTLIITLQTPFTYNGGHLLIGTENTTTSENKSIAFYCKDIYVANSNNFPSCCGASSNMNNIPFDTNWYVPKTTFAYTLGSEAFVYEPTNLTMTSLTRNSATVSWTAPAYGNVTGYAYQYKKSSESTWSAETTVTSRSATISGLSSITAYNFRVKTLTSNGASGYVTINFTTDCDMATLPFSYGFETAGLSPCWTLVTDNNNTKLATDAAYKGNLGFRFLGSNASQYLITPEFAGTTAMTVSFWYRPGYFYVGYSSTTRDIGAFTWLPEVTSNTTEWTQYEGSVPAGTKYIAIRYDDEMKSLLYIDEFSVIEYNPYPKPTGLTMTNIGTRSATVSWGALSGGVTGYAYQIKKATDGDNAWSAETVVTTTSATLNGLTPNTAYNFRLRAKYGSNYSTYSYIDFTTDCEVQSLPYSDSFENGIGCWTLTNCVSSTGASTYGAHEGSKSFDFFFTANPPQYLISPEFDGTASITVAFWYKNHNSNYTEKLQVGYSTTTKSASAFTWGSEITVSNAVWTPYEGTFPIGTKYVAVRHNSQNQSHLLLDDFEFTEFSNIEKPTNLTVTELTANRAVISWTDPVGQAQGYSYQYKKAGDEAWSTEMVVSGTSAVLSGLTPNTPYSFRVRVKYGSSVSTYAYMDFTTDCAAVSLPYSEGFEDGIGCWKLVDCREGDIATGVNAAAKLKGNNGFMFAFNHTPPQYLISPEFDGSTGVKVSFWYKNLNTAYTETFQVGYSTTTSDPTDFVWYEQVATNAAQWKKYQADFPKGTKHVAVRYNSDNKMRLFLDDFNFEATSFYVTSIKPKQTSADISWEGEHASYKVNYRTANTLTSIFYESFQEGMQGWNSLSSSSSFGKIENRTGYQGGRCVLFKTYSYSTTYPLASIISPAFTATTSNAKVSFYYRTDAVEECFKVGVSTTNSSINSIVWFPEVTRCTKGEWALYEEKLPANVKYIAIQCSNGPKRRYLYIDEISIYDETPWSTISTTAKSARINSLTANTQYDVKITGLQSGSEVANTSPMTFTTLKSGETYYEEPTNMAVTDIAYNGAVVSWALPAGVSATGYDYQYKKESDVEWSEEATGTATSATLSGLSSGTAFIFRVRAKYGSNVSAYAYASFTTGNSIKTLPYVFGFENGLEDWTVVNGVKNTEISSLAHHGGTYGFALYHSPTPPQYLISPQLDDATAMTVSFWYRKYTNTNETFLVGYSTTTNEPSAFTWGNEVLANNSDWKLFERDFPKGTKYVAIRYTSEDEYELHVDDFSFIANTAIEKPTDLTMAELTASSATVSWTAPATQPTGYACQYKKVNDEAWSDETVVTTTSASLSGLSANTAYTIRVRAIYDGSYSNYAYIDFTTDCEARPLPFKEGFENGIGCWQLVTYKEDNAIKGIESKAKHTGSYGFKFVPDAPSPQYLISPELIATSRVKVSFWYKNASSSYDETFQVGYSTTTNDPTAFTWNEEVTASNAQWTLYEALFPEGTKYIAVKYTSAGQNIYLDDFNFEDSSIQLTAVWPRHTTAHIGWTGISDSYRVNYRKAGYTYGQYTLLTENFESGSTATNWTRSNGTVKEEDSGHYIQFVTNVMPKATTKYLISKPLNGYTGGATLRLYYRVPYDATTLAKSESFYVGYSTTDNNTDNFVWGQVITAKTVDKLWHLYEMTLPEDVKYIGIKVNAAPFFHQYLDFDNITLTNDKTAEPWTTINTTAMACDITGLTANTQYDYQVFGLENGTVTTSTEVNTFTTLGSNDKVYTTAGNWDTAANWYPAGVPTAAQNVYIDADVTVPQGYVPEAKSITLYGGAVNVILGDAIDNTPTLSVLEGVTSHVTLNGRTFKKDGKWQTICLPFNLVLEDSPLEGATALPLTAASITGTTLNLTFSDAVDELVAGTPYMIKWESGEDIVNPVFSGVTIDLDSPSGAGGAITFNGTYDVMTFDAADQNVILFEEGSNTLKYAASDDRLGACRAYFVVDPTAVGDGQTGARLTDYIINLGSLGSLEGSFIQRGDANGDGNISVTDIAVVVNCILQLDNNGGFSEYGADANGDGQVTVTDIGVIVDKILGGNNSSAASRRLQQEVEPQ